MKTICYNSSMKDNYNFPAKLHTLRKNTLFRIDRKYYRKLSKRSFDPLYKDEVLCLSSNDILSINSHTLVFYRAGERARSPRRYKTYPRYPFLNGHTTNLKQVIAYAIDHKLLVPADNHIGWTAPHVLPCPLNIVYTIYSPQTYAQAHGISRSTVRRRFSTLTLFRLPDSNYIYIVGERYEHRARP